MIFLALFTEWGEELKTLMVKSEIKVYFLKYKPFSKTRPFIFNVCIPLHTKVTDHGNCSAKQLMAITQNSKKY